MVEIHRAGETKAGRKRGQGAREERPGTSHPPARWHVSLALSGTTDCRLVDGLFMATAIDCGVLQRTHTRREVGRLRLCGQMLRCVPFGNQCTCIGRPALPSACLTVCVGVQDTFFTGFVPTGCRSEGGWPSSLLHVFCFAPLLQPAVVESGGPFAPSRLAPPLTPSRLRFPCCFLFNLASHVRRNIGAAAAHGSFATTTTTPTPTT